MGAIRPGGGGGGGGGGGPVTIADISDAGAAGADVLAAATEADARTALGAAAAAGAVSLGTAYDAGLSTSAYLDVAGTPSAAPEWGPGQSLVMLLLPVATPSGLEILAMHSDTASTAARHPIGSSPSGTAATSATSGASRRARTVRQPAACRLSAMSGPRAPQEHSAAHRFRPSTKRQKPSAEA